MTTNVSWKQDSNSVSVCVGVHSVNADVLHRELFVYYSKLVQAPAVDTLQLYVNNFATIFI